MMVMPMLWMDTARGTKLLLSPCELVHTGTQNGLVTIPLTIFDYQVPIYM